MPAESVEFEPRVDAYINKCKPFAQPVLEHLREVVHKAVPDVKEEMKWSMPFFVLDGIILANMAGFKEHCSFGLWGSEMKEVLKADGRFSQDGMGSLGKLTSVKDLPSVKELAAYLKRSAVLIQDGTRTKSYERPKKAPKAELPVPAELAAAMKKDKKAAAVFAAFAPGCRREYVEWVGEAKREETRVSRAAQAVAWMAEGKKRNWKYENC